MVGGGGTIAFHGAFAMVSDSPVKLEDVYADECTVN